MVQIASAAVAAVWVLVMGQKQEVKHKTEPMKMSMRGDGTELNTNVPPGRGEKKEL